ncbi:MAG TPA: 4Fe-4S binding protein [Geminicoccaceae bacterium]|nr:4Fe-4S binding protein [Geminicoccus sp.]HMU50657.1 4Fe-4S binding protein [Geminicoccaceae bacterium]
MRAWLIATLLLVCLPAAGAEPGLDLLRRVVPSADRFEAVPGPPPYWLARRADATVGAALSTAAAIGSIGYSGKPLDILVGLDLSGMITGAVMLEQHEPIMSTGAKATDFDLLVAGLVGRSVREAVSAVRDGSGSDQVDAVAGATVSSSVIVDAVMAAARAVAREIGALDSGGVDLDQFGRASWNELVADGSLAMRRITGTEVTAALAALGATPTIAADPDATVAELWVGLASVARIGRNLIGDHKYAAATAQLRAGDLLLFVGGRGLYSFRGTSWRRGGWFDRIQIAQGDRTWRLAAEGHIRIDEISAADAPALRELSMFTIPTGSGFRADLPWRLQLMLPGRTATGMETAAMVDVPYQLPARYFVRPAPATPLWERIWTARWLDIAVLFAALAVLSAIFFFQEWLTARPRLLRRIRLGFLGFTLLWLGWYATAQLSVVNVLTFAAALRTGFRWDNFLLEPLIFILWCGVAAALILWGRGPFCGWLCPFGALQEILSHAARRLKVPQLAVPWWLHERLRSLKFLIFLGLFAISLGATGFEQHLAEIEPFKTAIVLHFWREPWFVAWALLVLGMGLFVERAWCRYLCPLGAALALPARLRQFEWLKRRRQCGVECRICALQCPVGAIQQEGPIHPGECIYCLNCQINYTNDHVCPPLIERRKRSERWAAASRQPTA